MRTFLRWIAPPVLLLATASTCFLAGLRSSGIDGEVSVIRGALFAASTLAAIGAHAAGHFVAAYQKGVDAYPPYFIPAFSLGGTSGAYVKLRWPISDMKTLFHIFAAGPIAGFLVSSVLFLCGLGLSDVVPRTADQLSLGDSLLTFAAQKVFFPRMAPTEDLMLHPVALGGYLTFFFNSWQLFPAGRLDGGRVIYALFGYRWALRISWLTITILAAFSILSPAWLGVAVFAALTMIRVSRQHPPEREQPPIQPSTIWTLCALGAILVLTFVPVPVRFGP